MLVIRTRVVKRTEKVVVPTTGSVVSKTKRLNDVRTGFVLSRSFFVATDCKVLDSGLSVGVEPALTVLRVLDRVVQHRR